FHLHQCRERLREGEPAEQVATQVPRDAHANDWLERRRGRLLMQLGLMYERARSRSSALAVYQSTSYPGARARAIRMLELLEDHDEALALAELALQAPQNEAETQQVERMLPRLRRRKGVATATRPHR